MLQKSKTALLISAQPDFSDNYAKLAESIGVKLKVEKDWNNKFRVMDEVVICGAKFLPKLHHTFYSKTVVILAEGESPAPYIKMGISRFIFNYKNHYELITALFYERPVIIKTPVRSVGESIEASGLGRFEYDKYDFRFDKDLFYYKGKPIYIRNGEKDFLAEWLLTGHKDNKRRTFLCNLRKRFGADFLKEVDRFGRIKEENDE